MAAGSGAVVKLSPAGSVSSRHLGFGQRTLVRMFKYFFAFLSVIDNTSTTACDAVSDLANKTTQSLNPHLLFTNFH